MVIKKDDPELLSRTIEILKNKGVVIAPCDTIYGFIGVVPDSDEKIRSIKGRGETKPFLQLIESSDELLKYSAMLPEKALLDYWPGPLTMILPDLKNSTVALRVPDDGFLRKVMHGLGVSIYSTSVNRSGHPPMSDINEIINEFENEADLIIDAGNFDGTTASTIISLIEKPYRILRQGSLSIPEDLL